jgi:hypothetical protein
MAAAGNCAVARLVRSRVDFRIPSKADAAEFVASFAKGQNLTFRSAALRSTDSSPWTNCDNIGSGGICELRVGNLHFSGPLYRCHQDELSESSDVSEIEARTPRPPTPAGGFFVFGRAPRRSQNVRPYHSNHVLVLLAVAVILLKATPTNVALPRVASHPFTPPRAETEPRAVNY